MAASIVADAQTETRDTVNSFQPRKIWIDLDNSPHVPFFIPIIKELEKRGHTVFLTTRDCFQVCGLAEYHNLSFRTIGTHYGANTLLKVLGTLWRSLQLAPAVLRERPHVSISHGSRSLILLSRCLGIPTILLFDYEHAKLLPFVRPDLGIAPGAITDPVLAKQFKSGLRAYPGLKEDVYVSSFSPDRSILEELHLNENEVIATLRPPATQAHYHNPQSEQLFVEVVEFLAASNVRMVILPRNEEAQRRMVRNTWPTLCAQGRIVIPDRVVDGLNLVWHSDLVVSGGGTMNREAAALGVPVYSIFRGEMGAVDRYLAQTGRLTLIESSDDVTAKIRPVKRDRRKPGPRNTAALSEIIAAADEVISRR